MGSGDGCDITYVDKEQNTLIKFEFNESNPYSDKEEEFLHYITLKNYWINRISNTFCIESV